MMKNNPTRGLLMYSFYSSKGNIGVALLLILALGITLLITGSTTVYAFFTLVAIGIPPYIIMIKMGAKNQTQWEKFQISMPLKRKNIVASFYLSIVIATFAGFLLCGVILGIGLVFHEGLMEHVIKTAFGSVSYIIGIALLMAGLLLPIGSTKFGENKGEVFFTLCLGIAAGIVLLIQWAGGKVDIPPAIISLSQIVIALTALVISYYITSKIYAKMDF
ncbi:MAG: ABC-2 transporter permease [Defluviitaleaceae bacterium]|nr:ABC-2 transporter permease [Defluviitaleaceae bacterium]